jgi:hypothetical protein
MIVFEKIVRERIKESLIDGDMTVLDLLEYVIPSDKDFYRKVIDRMITDKILEKVSIGSGLPVYYHLLTIKKREMIRDTKQESIDGLED